MAIVTRYFSTTGAGLADGTSWANRAELFTAGNWSSIITGFDFTTNSLECRIGPGTYSCSQRLDVGILPVDPTILTPIYLTGCDSSGNPLNPDSSWVSSQVATWESSLPVIQTSSNIDTIGGVHNTLSYLKLTATNRSGTIISSASGFQSNSNFVVFENSHNSASAACVFVSGNHNFNNCVFRCTAASYAYLLELVNSGGHTVINCRFEGNPLATSGTRQGVRNTSGQMNGPIIRCTVINNPGDGFTIGTSNSGYPYFLNNLVVNNGGDGVQGHTALTIGTGYWRQFGNNVITGNGGFGFNQETAQFSHYFTNNRFRNNALGNYSSGLGNHPYYNDDVSAGTDADEFVDASNGDFRIKRTSPLWGKNLGPGDEPASGSSGGLILPRGMNGGFGD